MFACPAFAITAIGLEPATDGLLATSAADRSHVLLALGMVTQTPTVSDSSLATRFASSIDALATVVVRRFAIAFLVLYRNGREGARRRRTTVEASVEAALKRLNRAASARTADS